MKTSVSSKTIGRLSLYRRLLGRALQKGETHFYSHQLAKLAKGTAAQVRRDLMAIGYSGNPSKGYDIKELIGSIGDFLDAPEGENAALIGVGNLGIALLTYFSGRRPKLSVKAAFDKDFGKIGRLFGSCMCYPMSELGKVVAEKKIRIAIIAVPAEEAQKTADRLAKANIKGILNFAPVPLHLPADIFVEDMDMTMALEKVAFFARAASE